MNQKISRREFATLAGSGVVAIALGSPLLASAEAVSTPDAQMKAVLDELTSFNAPPTEKLSPMNARNNPTVADAVMGVLAKRRKPAVEMVGDVNH
ncbi:hypothetical protein [Nostoc sp. 'Lobaria pulmonaria (5183) cyanobiont']|uniref:hypothetical protein n=1 Tax=Nostoc sp. 'Lobaria pulmonaria (5183) cyanobiont' TaxID=1618022 RepID=UPI000CF34421|nr:hypothetical protein [Nostoc sp. 'Lobaria pulmonaria (5183) cyanobiont']